MLWTDADPATEAQELREDEQLIPYLLTCVAVLSVVVLMAVVTHASSSPRERAVGLLGIAGVVAIEPRAEWRAWVLEGVRRSGRAPRVPFDSIAWYLAPRGMLTEPCQAGAAYVDLKAVVVSGSCGGGTKAVIVREAFAVMYAPR